MSTASMALLKGVPKKTEAAPVQPATEVVAQEQVPATAAAEEAVTVEIDDMDDMQLAALVAEHMIAVPPDWTLFALEDKKAWLNEQFGADDAEKEEPVIEKPVETVAPASSGKGKGKSKSVATNGKTGEVLPPDLISGVASELENLKEAEARKLVTELRENSDFGFFKLGGVLSVIQSNNWIEPHGSFKDFVEAEHGLNYRRAMYWIGIYNGLVESGIPWEAVKSLGWTKLKEIVPVITQANVKHWVKLAEKETTLQLIETVKQHLAAEAQKALGTTATSEPAQPVMTKTFKVHADQKKTIDEALMKAKTVSSTTVDTVALELICLDYLAGTGTAASIAGQLQKVGLEEALAAFEAAFPSVTLTAEIGEEAEAA